MPLPQRHTMNRPLLKLLLGAAAAFACRPLTGTWVDRDGNVAAIQTLPNGTLLATSLYGRTGWSTALGEADSTNDSLYLVFGGINISATLVTNCSLMSFSNNAQWSYAGTSTAPKITTVHTVFMTHLDVGFTALARDVCQIYFDQWLPQSIALAVAMRNQSTGARGFALTSHPFLIAEYLDGASGCARTRPNSTSIQSMKDAIRRGDVQWHGKFGNLFPELMDAAGFAQSLTEADRLNTAFNVSHGAIAVKSTDVPGLSRSVIPLLHGAGRGAVHMGERTTRCVRRKA